MLVPVGGGSVELARDAVVAEVMVAGQGAWALVLIEGNDDEDELALDGTLRVGACAGAGIVVVLDVVGADALNGDGVGAGVTAAGGAVWALTFAVATRTTMLATAPRRSHRSGKENVDRLGIIAGDP